MKILIQFPEGLKQKGLELQKKYEGEGHEVFLSASACYGACDIALDEARWLNIDKIVHVGHNKFVKTDLPVPVEYIDYPIDVDIDSLSVVLPYVSQYKKIAVATTVQHHHQFPAMKSFFEKAGKEVFIEAGHWAAKPGQVLGCDALGIKKVESKIEAVVFIGNGLFHPTAIDIDPKIPIFLYNTYTKKVSDVRSDIERLKKRRRGSLAAALSCKKFAILLSTKVGQFNPGFAKWAKKELELRGFDASILVSNELEILPIKNFWVYDCYINTACPRVVDDTEEFEKPILNIDMLKEFFALVDSSKSKPS
ncbi:diphthamide biosynthesis enzyme Dph2 [Candidatus Micrarchaeota archaeon]|nr:diphthamide biosynthesis enzyme Dph2 [Candidatus Micrarchaeota archaeon]